ncbi:MULTISPECIES: non-homologous end joining protein Ku [Streptomycetaceae]|uniref:Non-homologous end joining protein Ku n=1 Tax=Streptantibioticus cattleyicolor (strain ATCC 35852 / DSM 46488 / JCM 4925 / NBRC 14057 / NRRL 8057) TaxID=1003195 RepID=F8JQI4_STREN|nr:MULTISPECIES: Ku protein [Streptomycetaceae]AEW97828.1 Ku70/Ku80 protein [Streptantibioticus cattleyicolor NRRL 8057 = DSM 46488]MYS62243.1 Ku protein [Streptomyces sp. SID5468]CCB78146.1 Ku70/Ku80 protein [Streptantibioticus cattleyicolor NRRL 8057 = DSM 46488]
MRSIWKGAIGFGLVSIPVKLYAATEEHGVSLHQVHVKDGGRVRQRRVCEVCGEEVPYSDIAKGYQDDAGRTAVLSDSDLAELPLPSKRLIDVLAFVDAHEIDPLALSRAYYVGSEAAAAKPYVLLRQALVESGKAAVTKIALRQRESLALLRVHDDTLVLHTMYWPDEVRPAEGLAPPERVTVRPQELKMAASLMDTLSEDFDLAALHDEYQEALDELVEAKLEGKAAPVVEETTAAPDNVIDLMAALQASIREADAGRGGRKAGAATEETAPTAKPAKKTTAKSAPKKAAAKKTAAKKTEKTEKAAKSAGGTARKEPAGKTTAKKTTAKKTASRKRAS